MITLGIIIIILVCLLAVGIIAGGIGLILGIIGAIIGGVVGIIGYLLGLGFKLIFYAALIAIVAVLIIKGIKKIS